MDADSFLEEMEQEEFDEHTVLSSPQTFLELPLDLSQKPSPDLSLFGEDGEFDDIYYFAELDDIWNGDQRAAPGTHPLGRNPSMLEYHLEALKRIDCVRFKEFPSTINDPLYCDLPGYRPSVPKMLSFLNKIGRSLSDFFHPIHDRYLKIMITAYKIDKRDVFTLCSPDNLLTRALTIHEKAARDSMKRLTTNFGAYFATTDLIFMYKWTRTERIRKSLLKIIRNTENRFEEEYEMANQIISDTNCLEDDIVFKELETPLRTGLSKIYDDPFLDLINTFEEYRDRLRELLDMMLREHEGSREYFLYKYDDSLICD